MMKALLERLSPQARRNTLRALVGLALVVPAAMTPALRTPPNAPDTAEAASGAVEEPVVAAAWLELALSNARRDGSARFAEAHRIPDELAQLIQSAALDAGIEPAVAFGLVSTESSFRRTAVSWAGAVGYTQLLPSTARWIAPGTSRSELFEPETNLRVGFKYLRYLLDKYDGDMRLALTAYNRGPGTVDRLLKRGRSPWNGYADRVLSRARRAQENA